MPRPMKHSGVDWLGDIPADWKTQRGKNILTILERSVRDDDNVVTCFRDGEVTLRSNRREDGFTMSDKEIGYQGIDIGDLVVHGMDGFAGAIGISDSRGKATPVLNVMDSSQNKRYLMYYLRCAAYCGLFLSLSTGIRVRSCDTNWNKLKNVIYLLPPLDEQQRIANFLDDECARIDSVIEKTRASIEEYKKLKQAIITRAVTKGIRPNRTLKQSGIEWLGDIPSDWEVIKLKYVANFQPNCDTSKLTDDSEITYTPMECIKNGYFINNTALFGSVAASLTPYNEGDIVMAKVTPCFENGNIAVMENLASGFGLGSSELFVFRTQSIATRYLFYWLQNYLFMQQGCATMTGTGGLKRVSPYFVRNSHVTYPPLDEQKEIAQYLDEKTAAIDSLITKKNQLVTELERLKKSLIFEYVTGKKEVAP